MTVRLSDLSVRQSFSRFAAGTGSNQKATSALPGCSRQPRPPKLYTNFQSFVCWLPVPVGSREDGVWDVWPRVWMARRPTVSLFSNLLWIEWVWRREGLPTRFWGWAFLQVSLELWAVFRGIAYLHVRITTSAYNSAYLHVGVIAHTHNESVVLLDQTDSPPKGGGFPVANTTKEELAPAAPGLGLCPLCRIMNDTLCSICFLWNNSRCFMCFWLLFGFLSVFLFHWWFSIFPASPIS